MKTRLKAESFERSAGRMGLLGLGMVLLLMGMGQGAGAVEDRRTGSGASKSASDKAAESSRKVSAEDISKKLDQILANQEELMQRMDKLMEEIQVVKIRATMH